MLSDREKIKLAREIKIDERTVNRLKRAETAEWTDVHGSGVGREFKDIGAFIA